MEVCTRVRSNISRIILGSLLVCGQAVAQERHELVPDAAVVQYAGSIGFLSAGGSYDLFDRQRGSLDLLYGFVPESKGGQLDIITVKFAYRPLILEVGRGVTLRPLNPGAFLSYTADRDLSVVFDREQYGKGYYGWSEAFRLHLSLSQEAEFRSRRLMGKGPVKGVVLYSELNASDLYLISWVQNTGGISLADILKLGLGVKVRF